MDQNINELLIAAKCKYKYMKKCVSTKDLKEAQQAASKRLYHNHNISINDSCKCKTIKGTACTTNECFRRKFWLACNARCKEGCENNPWANKTFAAWKGKVEVKATRNKGDGLFAKELIVAGEYITEYTGVIEWSNEQRSKVNPCTIDREYLFEIPECNQSINAREGGSCARMINHSFRPNCVAQFLSYFGCLRIVIVAQKDIDKGTELTLNYGWTFDNNNENPDCFCEEKGCCGKIGTIPSSPKYLSPVEFKSIHSEHVYENMRPPCDLTTSQVDEIREDHVFKQNQLITFILFLKPKNKLAIASGYVLECWRNSHNIFIYVVRHKFRNGSYRDYFLPRFFIFSDRGMARQQGGLYCPNDHQEVKEYYTNRLTWISAKALKKDIPSSYSAAFSSQYYEPSTPKSKKRILDVKDKISEILQHENKLIKKRDPVLCQRIHLRTPRSIHPDSRKAVTPKGVKPTEEQKNLASMQVSYEETRTEGVKGFKKHHHKTTKKSGQKKPREMQMSYENSGNDEKEVLQNVNKQQQEGPVKCQRRNFPSRKSMTSKVTIAKEQKDLTRLPVSSEETGTEGAKVFSEDHDKTSKTTDQMEPREMQVSYENGGSDEKKVLQNSNNQQQGPVKCQRRNLRSSKSIHSDSSKIGMPTKVFPTIERKDLRRRVESYEETGTEGAKVFSKDHEKKLEGLLMKFNNEVMMTRGFDNAVETLAFLAMARAPDGTFKDINDAKSIMSIELKKFYEAPVPQQRKFLLFSHFILACEIKYPGSAELWWCSLCQLDTNFKNSVFYRNHFYYYHFVCQRYFTCDTGNCDYGTRLPSNFKDHILAVHQQEVQFSELSNQPHIIDAMSDFVALRNSAQHLYLITPGLPSVYYKGDKQTLEQPAKGKSQGVKMTFHVQTKTTAWNPKGKAGLMVIKGTEFKPNWRQVNLLVKLTDPDIAMSDDHVNQAIDDNKSAKKRKNVKSGNNSKTSTSTIIESIQAAIIKKRKLNK